MANEFSSLPLLLIIYTSVYVHLKSKTNSFHSTFLTSDFLGFIWVAIEELNVPVFREGQS